ncbi:hypothetical protein Tco_1395304 [Tanacetum coccineum]
MAENLQVVYQSLIESSVEDKYSFLHPNRIMTSPLSHTIVYCTITKPNLQSPHPNNIRTSSFCGYYCTSIESQTIPLSHLSKYSASIPAISIQTTVSSMDHNPFEHCSSWKLQKWTSEIPRGNKMILPPYLDGIKSFKENVGRPMLKQEFANFKISGIRRIRRLANEVPVELYHYLVTGCGLAMIKSFQLPPTHSTFISAASTIQEKWSTADSQMSTFFCSLYHYFFHCKMLQANEL